MSPMSAAGRAGLRIDWRSGVAFIERSDVRCRRNRLGHRRVVDSLRAESLWPVGYRCRSRQYRARYDATYNCSPRDRRRRFLLGADPVRGEDEARLYYDSQVSAINRIEAICRDERLDADFARIDGFLFAVDDSHRAKLEEEFAACRRINVEVNWADRAHRFRGSIPVRRCTSPTKPGFTRRNILRDLRERSLPVEASFLRTPPMSPTRRLKTASKSPLNRDVKSAPAPPCSPPIHLSMTS